MSTNFFNTLILLGVLQGFIFSLLILILKKYRCKLNFILGLLIFLLSAHNLQYYILDTNLINENSFYGYIYIPIVLFLSPLYYYYISFFLFPKRKLLRIDYFLNVPYLIILTTVIVLHLLYIIGYEKSIVIGLIKKAEQIHEVFAILYILIFFTRGWFLIRDYENENLENSTNKISLFWFKFNVIFMLIFSIICTYAFYTWDVRLYTILWILLSFCIYWLGHFGVYKYGEIKKIENIQINKIFLESQHNINVIENYTEFRNNVITTNKLPLLIANTVEVKGSEKKSEISTSFEASILQKIEKFEKSKKITDPNLTLANLASHLGTNTKYLSAIINTHKSKNYNAYINDLRINYIIGKILNNKEYANYKIAYLAEEAGFSSHSQFTKTFKQVVGLSPSEFLELNNKNYQ